MFLSKMIFELDNIRYVYIFIYINNIDEFDL